MTAFSPSLRFLNFITETDSNENLKTLRKKTTPGRATEGGRMLFGDVLSETPASPIVRDIVYLVMMAALPVLTLVIDRWLTRRRDDNAAKTQAQGQQNAADIEKAKVQHAAEYDERKLQNEMWLKLLDETKKAHESQMESRRKAHEEDMGRVERGQKKLHDRITHLERRDEACQGEVKELRAEAQELRAEMQALKSR